MKKLALLALVCTGCVVTEGTRSPDGSLTVTSKRFFWASEGIAFNVQDGGTNKGGLKCTLSVQKSTVDSVALSAVAEGVAKGIVAGAK